MSSNIRTSAERFCDRAMVSSKMGSAIRWPQPCNEPLTCRQTMPSHDGAAGRSAATLRQRHNDKDENGGKQDIKRHGQGV